MKQYSKHGIFYLEAIFLEWLGTWRWPVRRFEMDGNIEMVRWDNSGSTVNHGGLKPGKVGGGDVTENGKDVVPLQSVYCTYII